MLANTYDIIVIGAGSGGLSTSLFMNQAGFKVLLLDKSEDRIGGECLNDGCVPSKALIHLAKILHSAQEARHFGMEVGGKTDLKKALQYIYDKQNVIRHHENADFFRKEGLHVKTGIASFAGKHSIQLNVDSFESAFSW